MSVRKRSWISPKGERKEAWVVDYVDQKGERHIKTFAKKKDADAHHAKVKVEVRLGVHTADSNSITVAEAGEAWIKAGEENELERSTLDEYRRHLDLHIKPYIGNVKLSRLTAPMVKEFRTKLREGTPAPGQETGEARTPAMVKKIVGSLGSMVADAQESGVVAQNVVRGLTSRKKKGTKAEQRSKLKIGVDIPDPEEVKAIIGQLEGRWRPVLLTAIFTGLRASELRGLRWSDVDLKKAEIRVHQRADRFKVIDKPKSEAGERTVPLPPMVANALREWKLKCPGRKTGKKDADGEPVRELHYVFPNTVGNVEERKNIVNFGLRPAQIAAGVTVPVLENDGRPKVDNEGKPVVSAKYTGLHALRHFYASWCINPKARGGLELPPKVVQERMGHSTIAMTMDTYGHLFPSCDDGIALAEAERLLLV